MRTARSRGHFLWNSGRSGCSLPISHSRLPPGASQKTVLLRPARRVGVLFGPACSYVTAARLPAPRSVASRWRSRPSCISVGGGLRGTHKNPHLWQARHAVRRACCAKGRRQTGKQACAQEPLLLPVCRRWRAVTTFHAGPDMFCRKPLFAGLPMRASCLQAL